MKYTQIPADTFQHLVLNAGILVDEFTPADGTIGNLLGATTGGITFNANPTYSDWGEDIDNCPNNTMELKRIDGFDPVMSGTFLTVTGSSLESLVGSATKTSTSGVDKVVPNNELSTTDFKEVWWIGDYSDKNTGATAGFMAIHLLNALNQTSLQITTTKNGKGQLAFEYHGHYSLNAQDTVPFEVYLKTGTV